MEKWSSYAGRILHPRIQIPRPHATLYTQIPRHRMSQYTNKDCVHKKTLICVEIPFWCTHKPTTAGLINLDPQDKGFCSHFVLQFLVYLWIDKSPAQRCLCNSRDVHGNVSEQEAKTEFIKFILCQMACCNPNYYGIEHKPFFFLPSLQYLE